MPARLAMPLMGVVMLLTALPTPSRAWIRLNGIFTDHMVMQQGAGTTPGMPPARLFGLGYVGESVSIEGTNGFPGPFTVPVVKTGDAHWPQPLSAPWGNWSVNFTAPTNPGPYTVTIKSTTNTSDVTVLQDVVFGEVYFCNGQSNMELSVGGTDNKDDEFAYALALGDKVRINKLGGNLSLDGPQITPTTGNWTLSSDNNGTIISDFSAVCWGMGRRLSQWLAQHSSQPAPYVGMMEVSVGGTTIHHWVPQDIGIACNATGILPSKGEAVQYPPAWIYNARMNPMLLGGHGMTVRSVIYYQGEADSGENDVYSIEAYECELRGLVTSYRRDFGQPDMPILIVQLPGDGGTIGSQHDNDTVLGTDTATGWQAIAIAQQTVARSMPGVGLVALPDYGCCQLHYVHKSPVSERAANISRELVYADTKIDNRAPMITSVTRNPTNPFAVDIHLNNTFGLHLMDTYHCNSSYVRHRWGPNIISVTSANGPINVTCCTSTPSGHEGLGIVKFATQTTKHPHDYWGGWVPADIKIVSDTLVTATAVPPDGVNMTSIDMFDVDLGGVGCVLANANGQPLSVVRPTPLPSRHTKAVDTMVQRTHPRATVAPTPPAPACACDVCDDPNMLPPPDGRVRIAAVGDSITRGHPLRGKDLLYNYPCTLQRLLGDDKYVVFNFGAGGHTMLKASPPVLYPNKTIWNSTQYDKAMSAQPHVVLIMLGTNDAVGTIWKALGQNYVGDYADMINGFKALPSSPKVYALSSPPLYNGNFAGINQTVVNKILPGLVQEVATNNNLPPVVPVFDGMGGTNLSHHDWFWGNGSYGCHPNMQGYQALASIVYKAINSSTV
eukprot:m.178358 g.178358  ORF g.178358 m.178358 type:complete len:838 (+) comp14530_c0_seq1:74-2587(+)